MQSLGGDQLAKAFPFYVTVDADLRVVAAGDALVRREQGLIGRYLTEAFEIKSARRFPKFANLGQGPLVLLHAASQIPVRGAFLVGEGQATFLGTIWVADLGAMLKLGIDPKELSPTDPTAAYLANISRRNDSLVRYRKVEDEMRDMRRRLREAKDRMEVALRARSGFLSVMSHELRTPLNAIIGSMELLADSELQSGDAELVHAARQSADGLLERINDILDLIDLDEGAVALDVAPVDLAALIGGVVDEANAGSPTPRVRYQPASNVPKLVQADPRRVRRIVRELVGNALKFGDDGNVTVTLRTVHGPASIEVEVLDEGTGIDSAQMESLFEPFVVENDGLDRRQNGIGLGLALVRRLARLMGGDAEVSARPRGGSRFAVRLALSTATLEEDVRQLLEGRVLVVDDNLVNRKIAERFLQRLGLTVHLAADGHEAIELAQHETYDLILMDLQMPVLDGTDAARNIRQFATNSSTPIVALTANTRGEDRERCRDAGMNDFLSKPISSADLERIIHTFVAG